MTLGNQSKLTRYLEKEGFSSVLSNTKWKRLFNEIKEIEFTVDFQRKDLFEDEPDLNYWDGDIYHIMGSPEYIEWLNIRALISRPRGALLKPKIEDNSILLFEALQKAGVPYCLHGDGVRLWGYLRKGVDSEWAHITRR